jgi:hypothetical protein
LPSLLPREFRQSCPKIHGRDFHILLSIQYEKEKKQDNPFLSILPTVYGV